MEQETLNNTTKETTAQTDRLIEVLKKLEVHLMRQNSLNHALLRGLVYGFGMVIGATVLVAIFGSVIATMFGELLVGTPLGEITSQGAQ